MKRLFALLVVAGMCFVACGPSAEEKAKEEKRIADSIAKVEADAEAARLAEEIKLAEAAKLEAEAEAAKLAEEAANAKKPATATAAKKTTTTTTTTAEPAKTEPAAEPTGKSKLQGLKQTN